jgi:GAF domain-containing protein
VKQTVTSTPERVLLDQDTFQNLLAAAFVLQEEASRVRPKPPSRDHTQTLGDIVQIQGLIHNRQLDLADAAALIAGRAQKIVAASGAAVGMVEGEEVVYQAATGSAAGEAGLRLPIGDSLSAHCVNTGQVLTSANAEKDSRLSIRRCRERGLKSLIALPIYHEGKVAGVLELWFAAGDAFQEQDVHTCQLMAGLIAEAIARNAELEWKQALAVERATMLEALEKLKPQLERLTIQSAPQAIIAPPELRAQVAAVTPSAQPPASELPAPGLATPAVAKTLCTGCGHELGDEESFCGLCGTARAAATASPSRLPSKWAALWRMPPAEEKDPGGPADMASELPAEFAMQPPREQADQLPEVDFASLDFSTPETEALTVIEPAPALPTAEEASAPPAESDLSTAPLSPWSSALRARAWLESLRTQRPSRVWLARQWQARRANIYLVMAAILLLVVISGWATRSVPSNPSANPASAVSARRRKTPPPPQLTFFERILVGLGIAEPPPASIYVGSPNTQVWVDVHTALYYCPGADLYGKTPDGKLSTQHDAQRDQFEPANRKACD